jgi:threonine/homoserine/homoserine lactone efflux protein
VVGILPSWPLLTAFVAAAFILAVTPGPGVIYIVTRSLAQGKRAGLISVGGVALGNLGNALGAAIGLGAILAVSTTAFLVIKYAGALYLIFLGIKAFKARSAGAPARTVEAARDLAVFREGFLVALLNPKTALFFAAFLPQFMSPDAAPVWQSVALGAIFVTIAALTDAIYALAAGVVAPLLARAKGAERIGRFLSGGVFIGLGVAALYPGMTGRIT